MRHLHRASNNTHRFTGVATAPKQPLLRQEVLMSDRLTATDPGNAFSRFSPVRQTRGNLVNLKIVMLERLSMISPSKQ
jgi:hypothetical protein